MSLNTKNQKCVVCSAYLFEDDDIVYCPICGAPHHRDCYLKQGKCGLEEFHGTDKEYRREEEEQNTPPTGNEPVGPPPPPPPFSGGGAKVCRGCGMPLDENSQFCNNCGMPANMSGMPFGAPTINPEVPIAEGVNAGEAAGIVQTNTFRYIPKFLKLDKKNKSSWNWAAFLLPGGWFAFRKMYKESIIATILMIATTLMNIPLSLNLLQLPTTNATGAFQVAQHYAQFVNEIGVVPLALAAASLVISFIVRIVSGIFGDYIYKQRVVLSATLVKEAEDKAAAKKKYAGTSFIDFFLAVLALEFIPSVITMFL